jgi:RNA polymerase sigma-70 factor (ECF subfamily)
MMAEATAVAQTADPLEKLIEQHEYRDAVALAAREYGPLMGRYCMAMLGSQAEAEEACQEALVAAYRSMASYRGEGSVKAWLLGIARRICSKRLATRVREDRRLRLVHDADASAELPDALVESRRRAARVRDALDQLKPTEREAVVLRYGSGLAYQKVGHLCGIDEATARKRVSRALARLRSLLHEEGVS